MGVETIIGAGLGLVGSVLGSGAQESAAQAVSESGEAQAQAAITVNQQTIDYLNQLNAQNQALAAAANAAGAQYLNSYYPLGMSAYDTSMNNAVSSLNEWTTNAANRYQSAMNEAVAQYQPYAEVGPQAVQTLADWTYDPSKYIQSPGYDWLVQQGTQAIDRQAAASGRWNSPGTAQALAEYGQGLASQDYTNALSRLNNLVDIGQAGATGTANAQLSTGANIANLFGNQGVALSNLYANQGANLANAFQNWGTQLGNWELQAAGLGTSSNTSAGNTYQSAQNTYLNALNSAYNTQAQGAIYGANATANSMNSLSSLAQSLIANSYGNQGWSSNPWSSYYTNPWGMSLYG